MNLYTFHSFTSFSVPIKVYVYTHINYINFDFKKIQRTNESINLSATPEINVAILNQRWEIRSMSDDTLVGLSHDKNAIIDAITEPGYYYVTYKAQTTTDQYERRWDDIFVWYPKFTEEEADVVVDLSVTGLFLNGGGADYSGYKIYVKGSGTGGMWPYRMYGGSGYTNYVRIQKEIGNTNINQNAPTSTDPMSFSACRNLILDGYNDDGTRGWNLNANSTTLFECRISDQNYPSTGIHVMGVNFVRGVGQGTDRAAIRWEVPTATASLNASTWVCEDMALFDCRVENSGAEGLYWAYTNDQPQGGYTPIKFRNGVIAWNDFINCGNDAIQPCSSVNIRVHDNYINTWGVQTSQYHENAFSWNHGNSGRVYNNFAINGKVAFNCTSGLYPYDIYGGETTPQPLKVYNNVFVQGTPPSGGVTESIFIYGQVTNSTDTAEWPVEFFNNTIICNKICATWYFNSGGYTIPNFKFFNNIVVRTGNATDYPELDFIGPGTQPSSPVVNNLLRTFSSYSDLLFVDEENDDYRIIDLNSPAFTGASNLATYISGITLVDADGLPHLGDGSYTFGAYSGYGYKIITPTIDDGAAATFSVAPSVTSITYQGGTISFEANKYGILYYVVVPDGAAAPSKSQIKAGLNASGSPALASGKAVDIGTATTDIFTGLVESTAYDLYCVFVTRDWVEQAAATKVDFTTIADTIAPVLSGWEVRNAYPNRLYFNSSKIITATTYGGFTLSDIIGTIPTVTGITVNSGQLTDHYFTLSGNIGGADYLAKIAYSGSGSNIQDTANTPNALASFGATLITNSITIETRINVNLANYENIPTNDWNDADFTDNQTPRTLVANLYNYQAQLTGYVFSLQDGFGSMTNAFNDTGIYINNAIAGARGAQWWGTSGANSNGTVRFSGLAPGQICDVIYDTKGTFGTPAGTVNINGAGGVAYGNPYTEHKQVGIAADGSGNIDIVFQSSDADYAACSAIILVIYP